jgi:hypothetical protein
MACDISLGRIEPCKDSVGGLKNVYFVNFGKITGVTYNATNTDVIDSVSGSSLSAYKYELKGTNSFDQTITSNRENGTTFFEQNLKLTLKKLTAVDHKQIKLLSYGRPNVIVEDHNGNLFLCGLEYGMEVTGGTIVTGANMGDMSGYTLDLKASERVPANFIGVSLTTAGFTVVSGS